MNGRTTTTRTPGGGGEGGRGKKNEGKRGGGIRKNRPRAFLSSGVDESTNTRTVHQDLDGVRRRQQGGGRVSDGPRAARRRD